MKTDKLWYPKKLPADWRFPAPPVCTRGWSERDWVMYAAPYNRFKLELLRVERDFSLADRRDCASFLRTDIKNQEALA